jgi:hypothetical protein
MSKARDLSAFVSTPADAGSSVKLKEGSDNGSNFIELKSPASLAADVTFVLPNADGTNGQALTTNGSGALAWSTVGGGGSSITAGDSSVAVTDAGTGKVEVTVDNVEVADFTTGAIVFNETGANQDFRVEGDTDANLLFVDASADAVGIGTNAPINELTFGPTTSIISPDTTDGSDSKRLRFCGGGADAVSRGSYVTVYGNEYSGAEGELTLVAGDAVGGNIVFYTGSAVERMRITSAGAVEIANGNLVFSTNGTGIDFSASAGGGATSSLLDDYEEGTWTPSFTLDSGSATASSNTGSYVKIGKQVTVTLTITFSVPSAANVNDITGLPFTVENLTQRGVGASRENGVTGYTWLLRANNNLTSANLRRYDNAQALADGMQFVGTLTYFV